MDNSPFSPFVGRRRTVKDVRRRQSQLPSDLIDWDAPEIPELEKQKIIYEQIIQEMSEDHEIDNLINEQITQVAHETMIATLEQQLEKESQKERSQINLLLGQIKQFEMLSQELEGHLKDLESQKGELEGKINQLISENKDLDEHCRELEFHKQELEAEISCQLDTLILRKSEADELRKKLEGANCRMAYYKKLATK